MRDISEADLKQLKGIHWVQSQLFNTVIAEYIENTGKFVKERKETIEAEVLREKKFAEKRPHSHEKKDVDKKSKDSKKRTTKKDTSRSELSELEQFAQMLWNDVKRKASADVETDFDEDIKFGQETHCKHAMEKLDAFGKRKLRSNIAAMLENKEAVRSPVVTEKGAIIAFDEVPEGTQFFKCPFVEALAKQIY